MQQARRLPINSGVFSRLYRWPDKTVSIAYHTPYRSASTLESDSAEVWWRLSQSRVGRTAEFCLAPEWPVPA